MYTLSRKSRAGKTPKNGQKAIGWSEAGITRFNNLYDMVVEDRISNGIRFNHELLTIVQERRRMKDTNNNRRHGDTRHTRAMPKDDLARRQTNEYNNVLPGSGVHV